MESCLTPASAAMESKDAPSSVWLEVRPGVRIQVVKEHYGKKGEETLRRLSSDSRRSSRIESKSSCDIVRSYLSHRLPELLGTINSEGTLCTIPTTPAPGLSPMVMTNGVQTSTSSIVSSGPPSTLSLQQHLSTPVPMQVNSAAESTLSLGSQLSQPVPLKRSKGHTVNGK